LPTILFHSPQSDKAWPVELQKALSDHRIATDIDAVDPADVVAAVVCNPPHGRLRGFPNLRLIQVLGAGVDRLLREDSLPDGVPIARLVDPGLTQRMSEYVLMHCLALHRRMPEIQRAHDERQWRYLHPRPPAESSVGILGLGVLGLAAAQALISIGFNVVGWSRSRKSGLAFASFAGESELEEFKRRADILVLLLPLTPLTADFVDARFLATVKHDAALINVGRGALVVEDDLIAALDSGRLRHAVLDVFRTEPLPTEHRFWRHPAITVTPHNSSATNPATAVAQVVDNLRRALAGQRPSNLVDRTIGY